MSIFSILNPKILADFSSRTNKNIKVVDRFGNRIIYVQGAEQTGGTITGMWEKAAKLIQKSGSGFQNCLLLGLGGGDVIRLLRKIFPGIKITAVDIDPVMIKIAGRYFELKNSNNLKIIQSDALHFLINNKRKFRLIIIDLFIGFQNPAKFRTGKFLLKIKENLKYNGLAVYNSHYNSKNPEDFADFYNRCSEIFTKTEVIIRYPYSRILLLSA